MIAAPEIPRQISRKRVEEATPRWRKPLRWCAGIFAAVVVLLFLIGVVVARELQPLVRARLLRTFEQRFHSTATLDGLSVHYNGQIQVDGRGLRVQSVLTGVPGDAAHPMLQVQEFHFHLGVFAALSRAPRIHHVRIRGVQLYLPPDVAQQSRGSEPPDAIDLEYAEIDDAHIHFLSSAADRAPLQFDLPHLVLRGVSRLRPIQFHAVVDNGPPLGITETDGTIGPWNFDDPRLTPLRGSFAFQNKDVSSVHGLHGRLSLDGHYAGTVGSMHAEGTTEHDGFALDVSSHPVTMRTKFAMTLQPAQSSVAVERVEGSFGRTSFVMHGTAIKDEAAQSFRLDLQLSAPSARMEDVLALATHAAPPLMRGALALSGRLQMRAGTESVSRKLSLGDGRFRLLGATLTDPGAKQTMDELSERAQGNPKDANPEDAAAVSAAAHGAVRLGNEVLHVSAVQVTAPGARATLHGTYWLATTRYSMDGEVHTEAKLSHMTRGLKSLLLKPFNGLLGHSHTGGANLPLHIRGEGNTVHVRTSVAGIRMKPPGAE